MKTKFLVIILLFFVQLSFAQRTSYDRDSNSGGYDRDRPYDRDKGNPTTPPTTTPPVTTPPITTPPITDGGGLNPNVGGDREMPEKVREHWESWGGKYKEGLDLMQGNGILEEWFVDGFMPMYDNFMVKEYGQLIAMGQAFAGLFALLYLAWIFWGILADGKQWEIMSMLKPFALGLLLMNWIPFCKAVKYPFVELQKEVYQDYMAQQDELNTLRVQRFMYQQRAIDFAFRKGAEYEAMKMQQEEESKTLLRQGLDTVGDGLKWLVSPILEMGSRLSSQLQLFFGSLFELVALWILRAVVYGIFFIQLLIQTILIIVGPIAVAFSILPAFSNSFTSWLQKFINVNMYGFLAFIVLKLGVALQRFAFEAEIDRYEKMIKPDNSIVDEMLLVSYVSQGVSSYGLVIITFAITAIGMLMVPKLADYIVGSGGTHSALVRGVATTASSALGAKAAVTKALK